MKRPYQKFLFFMCDRPAVDRMPETTAASTSVSQKACHAPSAPSQLHSSAASGMMKTTYRHNEMTRDSVPLPRPSSAPESGC